MGGGVARQSGQSRSSNTAETNGTYRGRMLRRRSVLVDRLEVDRPGSPQQAILDELRRVILDGAALPGTPIPLAEVADLFGVSQIPVRESLKTLIGEGLVAHRSNSGYTVAQLTVQELREMYIVRETLEAASLASAVSNATDADRTAILEANDLLQQAIDNDDPRHVSPPEQAFPPRAHSPVADVPPAAHARIGMEHDRTRAIDGACRAVGSGRAARRSSSDGGRIPRRRCRATSHGCRTPRPTSQLGDRHLAHRHRAVAIGGYIFDAITG